MPTTFDPIRQLFHITDNQGFSEHEILAYKNVCETIPKVLFDYYQQLGKCEFNQAIDYLLNPNEMYWFENDKILVFYQERESVCDWGMIENELNTVNAMVFRAFDGDDWQPTVTIQEFLIAMAHWQAIFSLPFKREAFIKLNPDNFKILEQNFARKSFYLPHESDIYFYGNHADEVISVEKSNGVYLVQYASFDEQQFDKLEAMLGNLGE